MYAGSGAWLSPRTGTHLETDIELLQSLKVHVRRNRISNNVDQKPLGSQRATTNHTPMPTIHLAAPDSSSPRTSSQAGAEGSIAGQFNAAVDVPGQTAHTSSEHADSPTSSQAILDELDINTNMGTISSIIFKLKF